MRNVRLLMGIAFFSEAVAACVPYLFPLARQFGGTENTVLWLQLDFIILLAVLQLPTGLFADRRSYKRSILYGSLIIMTGSALYLFGRSLWVLFLAEGIWALGSGLIQGADTSLLQATLDQDGRSSEFQKLRGKLAAIRTSSRIGYFFIGGYLVEINLYAPFALAAGFLCCSFVLSLILQDTRLIKKKERAAPRQLRTICVEYLNPATFIGQIVIAQALILSSTYIGFWLSTPWMEERSVRYADIGMYLSLLAGLAAISHMVAAHRRLSTDSLLPYAKFMVVVVAGFFLLSSGNLALGILGLGLHKIAYGFTDILIDKQLMLVANRDERATILSIAGMLRNACMSFLLLVCIGLREFTTVAERYGSAGILVMCIGIFAFACYWQKRQVLE